MKINRNILRNILVFILVLGLVALFNLLLHEFGHCITMDAVGGDCDGVYVTPGIKVWPLKGLGQRYSGSWNNYFGLTHFSQSAPNEWTDGLVFLMGSGAVAVLSLLALVVLYAFRPKGWVRFPLLAQSLMFLDLLFYTILPRWFGLRHFFFIGGDYPEPLDGAIQMGIPESTFITGFLVYSVLMTAVCLRYVLREMHTS